LGVMLYGEISFQRDMQKVSVGPSWWVGGGFKKCLKLLQEYIFIGNKPTRVY